jgi:hypothetical protein
MLRHILGILILLGFFYLGKQLYLKFQSYQEPPKQRESQAQVADGTLPGLHPSLEASLAAAKKQGVPGMRKWLRDYAGHVKDPRLAEIELDYVMMLTWRNPDEAKRIFQAVKARTPPSSPLYQRVKSLETNYQ